MYNNIKKFIENSVFTKFITYLIILNGITMGFETSKEFMTHYGVYTTFFNHVVISIFIRGSLSMKYLHFPGAVGAYRVNFTARYKILVTAIVTPYATLVRTE
jgi:hypothetical protein